MIPDCCIEVQTSPEDRPAVPPWFAEVVIVVEHLLKEGVLDAFAHQIRLVRGRFGRYEPIDFLALLIGYAISGERTLADFFERVSPFKTAFMALFGRKDLPHRSSLSRFLADVDQSCLEAFRVLFQQKSFADGWTAETLGGIFDRQGHHFIVFDVDATRQAARQRALPCSAELPPAQRRLDAVCAPGYQGRKRGEVVRTRTTALQMHTRQWIGTYAGRGNGDYRGELASALQAITTYLAHFAFPPSMALVRLDGQYGDAAVIAQIILAGVGLVTRGRGYQLLDHPHIQQVLTHPPTAKVIRRNTGETVELFDGGWLTLDEGFLRARVIVTRYLAPTNKPVRVGKHIGEWVYELFITTLDAESFLVEDVLDLYHGRGAFEVVFADEDVENDADRWCSYTEGGQELWQIACQWVWNIRLTLSHAMHGKELRDIEWSSSKTLPPLFTPSQELSETYGPWKWAKEKQRERTSSHFRASDFPVQANGTLQCPAGASLWLSELRQENPYTQRAIFAASLNDCRGCQFHERCLTRGASGNRARRVSVVRHLLPAPSSVEPRVGVTKAMHWVDVAARALRRTWVAHWRRQYVEVTPLAEPPEQTLPPPRPPRAIRSHSRWSWHDRLTYNKWWGPPQHRIYIAGVPSCLVKGEESRSR